ncbi:PLP-dependent aminotransferase family protein, partial [Rhizobium ruizarguesonis]
IGPFRQASSSASGINPMAALMSAERRQALATVAAKHEIAIIENDIIGPMVEGREPPMAAFAPERTLYVTSFTKITVP